MPRRSLAALVVLAASLWAVPQAAACGMPLEATIPSEKALISYADGRQELVLSVVLDTNGPNAALVTPVPGVPDKPTVVEGDIFGYLEEVTRPEPKSSGGGDDGATSGAPGGVDVIGRDIVGDYDIARLAADDPDALTEWLKENDYETPPGAQPIIDSYVADDWKFVAIKLREGAKPGGAIKPIRVAFPSKELVFPMRLDALEKEPIELDLYVLADRQMRIGNDPLQTEYAGPVSELDRPPPPELRSLFRAPYLTKLSGEVNPQGLHHDFILASAPSEGDVDDDTNFPLLVIVLIVVPLIALSGFAIWLVRGRREA